MHPKCHPITMHVLVACGWALSLLAAPPALAVQHLIKAGDDWQYLGSRVRPGDEIILMPGRHRSATFERLVGAPQRPITIRSADPLNPCTITADREGIRVKSAAYLVIKDLAITGGTVSGISLAGSPPSADPATTDQMSGSIVLQNLAISRIGPRGQRHCVLIRSMENVRIDNCEFEGWGGSAVEIVACRDVTVARCRIKGLEDHGQINGIRVRAGSRTVTIEDSRFENAGMHTIFLGGRSDAEEWDSRLPARAPSGALAPTETTNVQVQRNMIIGSACTVAFQCAEDCIVRNNTIVGPKQCVLAMLTDEKNPLPSPALSAAFGMNLITWQPGELSKFAEVSSKLDVAGFLMEENLWWSQETPEQRQRMGSMPGKEVQPQIFEVDPKLDNRFKTTEMEAQEFGVQ